MLDSSPSLQINEELLISYNKYSSLLSSYSLSLSTLLIDSSQAPLFQKQFLLKLFTTSTSSASSSSIYIPSLWLSYIELLNQLYIKNSSASTSSSSAKSTLTNMILKVSEFLIDNEDKFNSAEEELSLLKIHLEYLKLLTSSLDITTYYKKVIFKRKVWRSFSLMYLFLADYLWSIDRHQEAIKVLTKGLSNGAKPRQNLERRIQEFEASLSSSHTNSNQIESNIDDILGGVGNLSTLPSSSSSHNPYPSSSRLSSSLPSSSYDEDLVGGGENKRKSIKMREGKEEDDDNNSILKSSLLLEDEDLKNLLTRNYNKRSLSHRNDDKIYSSTSLRTSLSSTSHPNNQFESDSFVTKRIRNYRDSMENSPSLLPPSATSSATSSASSYYQLSPDLDGVSEENSIEDEGPSLLDSILNRDPSYNPHNLSRINHNNSMMAPTSTHHPSTSTDREKEKNDKDKEKDINTSSLSYSTNSSKPFDLSIYIDDNIRSFNPETYLKKRKSSGIYSVSERAKRFSDASSSNSRASIGDESVTNYSQATINLNRVGNGLGREREKEREDNKREKEGSGRYGEGEFNSNYHSIMSINSRNSTNLMNNSYSTYVNSHKNYHPSSSSHIPASSNTSSAANTAPNPPSNSSYSPLASNISSPPPVVPAPTISSSSTSAPTSSSSSAPSSSSSSSLPIITVNDIEYLKMTVLGKGGSSVVSQVFNTKDKQVYALKKVQLSGKKDRESVNTNEVYNINERNRIENLLKSIQEDENNKKKKKKSKNNKENIENNDDNNENDREDNDEEDDDAVFHSYLNEINLLKSLQNTSPYIIQLYDYYIDPSNQLLLMILEAGEIDLAKLIKQYQVPSTITSGGSNGSNSSASSSFPISSIDPIFARMLWKQMLLAVDHIHRHRIVHGDLKPANFVFCRGMLKLIDFGIAKKISNHTVNVYRETQMGTVNYMSPEAIMPYCSAANSNNSGGSSGESSNGSTPIIKLGTSSDVWSLGCILFQFLWTRPPLAPLAPIQKLLALSNSNYHILLPGDSPISSNISQSNIISQHPSHPDQEAVEVVRACLIRDPERRAKISSFFLPSSNSSTSTSAHTPKVPILLNMKYLKMYETGNDGQESNLNDNPSALSSLRTQSSTASISSTTSNHYNSISSRASNNIAQSAQPPSLNSTHSNSLSSSNYLNNSYTNHPYSHSHSHLNKSNNISIYEDVPKNNSNSSHASNNNSLSTSTSTSPYLNNSSTSYKRSPLKSLNISSTENHNRPNSSSNISLMKKKINLMSNNNTNNNLSGNLNGNLINSNSNNNNNIYKNLDRKNYY